MATDLANGGGEDDEGSEGVLVLSESEEESGGDGKATLHIASPPQHQRHPPWAMGAPVGGGGGASASVTPRISGPSASLLAGLDSRSRHGAAGSGGGDVSGGGAGGGGSGAVAPVGQGTNPFVVAKVPMAPIARHTVLAQTFEAG